MSEGAEMREEINFTGMELEIISYALENLYGDIMDRRGVEAWADKKNEARKVQDVMYMVREMHRQHDKDANRDMLSALMGPRA